MNEVENKKIVIGITGPIGSGKDTVADYIANKLGVEVFQVSAPIKDYIRSKGEEVSRINCQKFGNIIAKEFGPDYSAVKFLENLKTDLGVISGFRQLPQLDYLFERTNFFLIAVDAPAEIRYQHVIARGTVVEQPNLEAFIAQEHDENSGESIMRVFECMKRARLTIQNDSDLESLYGKCDEVLIEIRQFINS